MISLNKNLCQIASLVMNFNILFLLIKKAKESKECLFCKIENLFHCRLIIRIVKRNKMIEFDEIEKEFDELERNDEWDEHFKVSNLIFLSNNQMRLEML